ncbi:MAG: hypothetical protein ACI4W6_08760 [Acutalibacteraceae bacterium]
MGCNGMLGNNCCTWIIILLILWFFCGDGMNSLCGRDCDNNCGCGC